jgi:outer membrane protein assembly factor BamB
MQARHRQRENLAKMRQSKEPAAVPTVTVSDNGGALPPGWRAAMDKERGAVYYYNSETGETTWTRPTTAAVVAQAAVSQVEELETAPGWEQVTDETTGEVYFYNAETQESSWDRPVACDL